MNTIVEYYTPYQLTSVGYYRGGRKGKEIDVVVDKPKAYKILIEVKYREGAPIKDDDAIAELYRNDIEIDFIISNNSKTKYKMYPIEVKSGTRYTTASLLKFKEKYKGRIGCCYIIHPRNLIVKDYIICIPPYMTVCL